MIQLLLSAYREFSGRGIDYGEDYVPLSELIDRFPDILIPIPFYLLFLLIAYLILSRRSTIDKYWFYINEEDNEWYKTLIIFGWIAGVLCILPTIFTSIEIIFRVLVGGTLTILNWILSWILSIFILLQMVGLIPSLAYLALEEKHKSLAKLVGLILLCITLYIVITLWNTIMDWSFMFPPLKFNI